MRTFVAWVAAKMRPQPRPTLDQTQDFANTKPFFARKCCHFRLTTKCGFIHRSIAPSYHRPFVWLRTCRVSNMMRLTPC
jgi:hypothetical protein